MALVIRRILTTNGFLIEEKGSSERIAKSQWRRQHSADAFVQFDSPAVQYPYTSSLQEVPYLKVNLIITNHN